MTARLPAGPPDAVVFLGTPEAAVPSLAGLHAAGLPIRLVVTRPDTRRGRRESSTPCPVKRAALDRGIPVSHDVVDVLRATEGSSRPLGVVVAYGRVVPEPVLDLVPMVNLHFSLLPRWRGAAPVERAILAGDRETGTCVMELTADLDAGPIHACTRTVIGEGESADGLRARLAEEGAAELVRCCAAGFGVGRPQDAEPSYAAKIVPADLAIDWNGPASTVLRQVRVGGAHTVLRGVRTRILRAAPVATGVGPFPEAGGVVRLGGGAIVAACRDGAIELVEMQQEGRRVVDAASWWNGVTGSNPGPVRFGR